MSRRAIRKAFPEPDLGQDGTTTPADSGSDLDLASPMNPFLALNSSDDSVVDSSKSLSPVSVRALSPAKKIKKKKRQKCRQVNESDAIDQAIQNRLISVQNSLHNIAVDAGEALQSLLVCHPRYFDADRELRSVFGASVLREDQPVSAAGRIRRTIKTRTRLRKTTLIKPKDEWSQIPLSQIGLSMQFDPESRLFQFEMSPDYLDMQNQFESASMTFNPQSIATLLQFQPWHSDTLIQMGEIYRAHGELALGSDLIARALYAFECNFNAKFDILSGATNCCLNPHSPSTISFIRAVRRHMQFTGRKGCARTAFEICKLFFKVTRPTVASFPSAHTIESLMHMVYYAFRSTAFSFILDFASHFDLSSVQNVEDIADLPLSSTLIMLPIWTFTVALSKYRFENEHDVFNDVVLVTKAVNHDSVTSSLLIQQCLLLYPEVLEPLLTEARLNEKMKPNWTAIFSHQFFRDSGRRLEINPSLQKLVNIFVTRCHDLWKEDSILDWLAINAQTLILKMNAGICVSDEYDQSRSEFFESSAFEEASKLDKCEFSDSISTIPMAEQQVNIQPLAGPPAENSFIGQNPLMAFVTSLLPWFNVPEQP